MKFNLTEIGGRETGATAIRPVGTTTLEDALAYANAGRRILGDFKQRLQQGGLKDGRFEQALKDGTVITVITNMIGLAPIDQIYVDTGNRKLHPGINRCLGYIVQCIADAARATEPIYSAYYIRTELPTGEVLNSKSVQGLLINPDQVPTSLSDFPDNGAKYLDFLAWDGADFTLPSDFQLVSTLINNNSLVYEKLGPITYSKGAASSEYSPMTDLSPGWSFVTAYTADSGVCGMDADNGSPVGWSFESIPCTNTLHVLADFQHKADEVYDGDSFTGTTLHYSGSYTQAHLPLFPDGCLMDYSNPYNAGAPPAYSPGTFSEKVNDWDSRSGDIYVALMNEASAYAYAYEQAFYTDNVDYTYQIDFGLFGSLSNKLGMILRRNDDKGFITYSGFDFSGGRVSLYKRDGEYGQTALFMVPFNDTPRIRYDDGIQSVITAQEFHQDTNFKAGGSRKVTDGTTDSNCGVHNMGLAIASGTFNIIEHWDITNGCADSFAIPVKVEYGIHTVGVAGNHGDVRVWLLVEMKDGSMGMVKINHTLTSHNDWRFGTDTPDMEVKIKVGEFEDIGEVATFADL
jgi:hypothetical protein